MAWYMNFCAPFVPNDTAINFHRFFQTSTLAFYTLIYALIHIYYIFYGPLPLAHRQQPLSSRRKRQEQSENSSNLSDNKELSIKLEQHANDSCIQLKKTGTTWNNSNSDHSNRQIVQNVTLAQIEQYHSIVYGHYAIAVGLSTMYTPYFEQSIAILVYAVLTIPLMLVNSKRMEKTTRAFWIGTLFRDLVMAMILMFLFTTGLLEVGQSNWDVLNLNCFGNLYTSLYN